MIPFLDLSRRLRSSEADYLSAVSRVMRSGTLLLGPELSAFEAEAAAMLGGGQFIGVSSGAAAIQITLEALGIGPGDDVIVPAFTAVPTASAVSAAGARPIPVDVDPETALIDPRRVEEAITERTRAVVPVHLYGRPVDIDPLAGLGLSVVEDAAQATGAVRPTASVAVTYSFYPTKNIGGIGDGGAVATSDESLADMVRRRRVHGMTEQYVHTEISQNFRMSEIEAAWLRLQLPSLAEGNRRRAEIARHYRSAAPDLHWQADHPDHVYHLCVARFTDRAAARAELAALGVASAVQYPLSILQQPAFRDLPTKQCPEADAWAAECVSLPCFPELTDVEVETVGRALATVRP
ncbi:MAG: DegT/DnrJ/EryC1/StrS family aminotransferase [Ilumatobacteraceae bacterium]